MPEKVPRNFDACMLAFPDRVAKLVGIPVDYDRREQVQPSDPEVLGSGRPVPDRSLASDPQGALQGMMRLALVQAETGTPLHVDIEQPVDHEQRPFDPSDLPQRDGKVMLARIGRELSQELARRHRSGHHRGHAAQDIGPVGGNRALPDPVVDQPLQFVWDAIRVEDMKPFGREIANAGNETVAREGP